MARSRSFKKYFLESMRDPQEWRAYLQAVVEDFKEDDEESLHLLIMALRDIRKAQSQKQPSTRINR